MLPSYSGAVKELENMDSVFILDQLPRSALQVPRDLLYSKFRSAVTMFSSVDSGAVSDLREDLGTLECSTRKLTGAIFIS